MFDEIARCAREANVPVDESLRAIVGHGPRPNDVAPVDFRRQAVQCHAAMERGRVVQDHADARTGAPVMRQQRRMEIHGAAFEPGEDGSRDNIQGHRRDQNVCVQALKGGICVFPCRQLWVRLDGNTIPAR